MAPTRTLDQPPAVATVADNFATKTGLVWFKRSDLRLTDHEPFWLAHRDCEQVAHMFCLDDRWFGHSK